MKEEVGKIVFTKQKHFTSLVRFARDILRERFSARAVATFFRAIADTRSRFVKLFPRNHTDSRFSMKKMLPIKQTDLEFCDLRMGKANIKKEKKHN